MIDLAALAAHCTTRMRANDCWVVGIGGRGGSGKSTLAAQIAPLLGAHVIALDDLYRTSAERTCPREGHGQAYDVERILALLARPSGRCYERYDWDRDERVETVLVPDGPLVVEGIYALSRAFLPHLGARVWVETPRAVRLARGVERDGEGMRAQWTGVWMPAEDAYVDDERPDLLADARVYGH